MRHTLHTLFRGWRAALLLVVVALLSPQRAAAGCGDHVTVLNLTAQPGHDVTPASEHSPLAPPCDGPNCSRKPDRPAPRSAPPAPTVAQAKHPALGGLPTAGDPTHAHFDLADAAGRPVHRPFSVFHPPRAV